MAQSTKYRAKHVYWDASKRIVIAPEVAKELQAKNNNKRPDYIWRFDSQHELKVYRELVRMFGADRIIRQYTVEIVPESRCYPNGRKWRVDFAVIGNHRLFPYQWLVEAKGAFLPEFAVTLSFLEQFNINAFIRTFIIFTDEVPVKNQVVKSLMKTSFNSHLLTLKELEQLSTLK